MKEKRTETPEARERRLYHYRIAMEMLEAGKNYHLSGRKDADNDNEK